MLPFTLTSFLLATLLGATSTATQLPAPVFITNATLVKLGQSFTANCQMMSDFEASSTEFHMRFHRNYSWIIVYDFPAYSPGAPRRPDIKNYSDNSTTVRSLRYNLTMVEVEFTPLKLDAFFYYCNNPDAGISNYITVKVVDSLPTVTFSLNTSKLTVNRHFTATCDIGNFNLTTCDNYTITFYSKREGRLATYETVQGTSVLLIKKHLQLLIHHGHRTSFPAFDLDLTLVERQNVSQAEYWCALEGPTLGKFESTHWVEDPAVSFTGSKANSTTRLGTCSLGNFEPAGKEYTVQFWTDLGPKAVNRLGTYAVKPNEIIEFLVEEVSGWTNVQTGDAVTFPNFTILATEDSPFVGTWWCVLGLGVEGTADYREIKSSAVNLA